MTGIRILVGAIITAMVGVALVPLFVLLDLVGGGDGWGLCPDGLASCGSSYFDGPELAASLLLVLFMLLALLRMALQIERVVDGRRARVDRRSMGRRDRLGRG